MGCHGAGADGARRRVAKHHTGAEHRRQAKVAQPRAARRGRPRLAGQRGNEEWLADQDWEKERRAKTDQERNDQADADDHQPAVLRRPPARAAPDAASECPLHVRRTA
eukprot:scaffold13776_cov85-Isochrysis_galbana.AAC.1